MSIEVTMRHSDVKIESLKDYAQMRMEKLQQAFPKVTKISIVIDAAAARAERQLLKMRVKARKGNVRAARAGSPRN